MLRDAKWLPLRIAAGCLSAVGLCIAEGPFVLHFPTGVVPQTFACLASTHSELSVAMHMLRDAKGQRACHACASFRGQLSSGLAADSRVQTRADRKGMGCNHDGIRLVLTIALMTTMTATMTKRYAALCLHCKARVLAAATLVILLPRLLPLHS